MMDTSREAIEAADKAWMDPDVSFGTKLSVGNTMRNMLRALADERDTLKSELDSLRGRVMRAEATLSMRVALRGELEEILGVTPAQASDEQFKVGVDAARAMKAERDTLRAEVERMKELAERLKTEAQIHAQEARTQRATVHGCYQAVGAQVGDWHGAQPVRDAIRAERTSREQAEALVLALEKAGKSLVNEATATLAFGGDAMRTVVGNTNVAVLQRRVDEMRRLLWP